ncbi:MAG: SDR family NAD(P)-dependent oxidoreductase [Balneolaceae bacterium]
MKNKTIVITGGTGGIGIQSAIGIAKTGARILITGRNKERGDSAVQRVIDETGNKNIELVVGDVSYIEGIDKLAISILKQTNSIDVLVNNAGYAGNKPATSKDGLEMHFAINVLAPWRLTMNLLPTLKAAENALVLNITGGDKPAAVDPDNLQAEKGFRGMMTYTHSKSILESMTMIMAEKLKPEGINVNVLFPGRASTTMTRSMSPDSMPGFLKLMYPIFKIMFKEDGGKSAAKAAQSTIWGATSSDLENITGKYYDTNCKEQRLHPSGYDPDVQARILAFLESI